MARYSAVAKAQAANTTLPAASLYAPADAGLVLREIGVFSVGTAAARILLARLTTAGTQGAGIIENEFGAGIIGQPVSGTAFNAHTVAPTLGTEIAVGGIGAAAGSGFILTYYGENNGLVIPEGVANGIGVLELADTANTYDIYFVWDE